MEYDYATCFDRKSGDRISCYAAPEGIACAAFNEESRMKYDYATCFDRKFGERVGPILFWLGLVQPATMRYGR